MAYRSKDDVRNMILRGADDGAVILRAKEYLSTADRMAQDDLIKAYEAAKLEFDSLDSSQSKSQDQLDRISELEVSIGAMEASDSWLTEASYPNKPEITVDSADVDAVLAEFYDIRRKMRYPEMEDYLDAQVKKSSDDPDVAAEGVTQEADYFAACLQVKADIPKPS